jgi:hypothetical protein
MEAGQTIARCRTASIYQVLVAVIVLATLTEEMKKVAQDWPRGRGRRWYQPFGFPVCCAPLPACCTERVPRKAVINFNTAASRAVTAVIQPTLVHTA